MEPFDLSGTQNVCVGHGAGIDDRRSGACPSQHRIALQCSQMLDCSGGKSATAPASIIAPKASVTRCRSIKSTFQGSADSSKASARVASTTKGRGPWPSSTRSRSDHGLGEPPALLSNTPTRTPGGRYRARTVRTCSSSSGVPHHADLDHVFWRGDARLTISRLDQCYYRARAMAGLAHVRLHDLRHSFASHAASMSETLPMISRLLGHTSVKMTARYAHLDDACVVDAAERLGELLRKATGEGL